MDSSSIAPSLGGMECSEVPCDPLSVRGAKRMVMSSGVAPLPILDMVKRDHGTDGSMAAFFKESMSRDIMIGTKTVFTLLDASRNRSLMSLQRKKKKLTPQAWAESPPEHK